MEAIERNRRLAPLVEVGYDIYRGVIALPPAPPAPPKPPIQGCSEAAYREGLEREIEEKFSAPEGSLEYLVARVKDGSLAGFTEQDCADALGILDQLLEKALYVESSHGDGPEAERLLEAEVPGLPKALYASLLGFYAYINR